MQELKQIYEYYKHAQSVDFARRFRKKMFDKVALLKSFPKLGKKLNVKNQDREFRFLLEGHYKILYSIGIEAIEIESILDSRSNK